jgi:nicotinate-nucleotide pyrophosphorylase (carboxylating)
MDWSEPWVTGIVTRALGEDLGEAGDVTTRLVLPDARPCSARIVAKADGTLAGLPFAVAAFRASDPGVLLDVRHDDGDRVAPGEVVMTVAGDARAVLAAERTALNFLQRLSGIATLTRRFVDAVAGTASAILETRKTTPGLRLAEKYAVRAGGGRNHRMGLYDQVLLKENHFACAAPEDYESVVRRAVTTGPPGVPVIAEARDVAEARAAVRGGAGVVMLDNFEAGEPLSDAIAAVRATAAGLGRTVEIEVSGGIRLENVATYARSGADRISVGALTHSAPALDLSLLVEVHS